MQHYRKEQSFKMKSFLVIFFINFLTINSKEVFQKIKNVRNPVYFDCENDSGILGRCSELGKCLTASTLPEQSEQHDCGNSTINKPLVCCMDIREYLEPKLDVVYFEDMKINEKKCYEYISEKQRMDKILTMDNQQSCFGNICRSSKQSFIIGFGGFDALLDEFPHMAVLGWEKAEGQDYDWNCGGTLISENFVLSAAHCFYSIDPSYKTPEPTIVKLGDSNPLQVGIASVIPHPEYKALFRYNDIGLVKLEKNIEFFMDIRPACLGVKLDTIKKVTMLGWGYIDHRGTRPQKLQKVALDVYDDATCNRFNPVSRSLPNGIDESQFCAGSLEGGRDACLGDSGGPIQVVNKRDLGIYDVVGIVSFGIVCGARNGGVYTRVDHYIEWIEQNVWPDS